VVDSLFPDGLASMIACPTDFHSDTGDCHVKVGEYTDDYAEVAARDASDAEIGHDDDGTCKLSLWTGMDAPTEGNGDATLNEPGLAVSKLAKRMSTKDGFELCDSPKLRNRPIKVIRKFASSKLSFQGSGDMINKKNGYTEDSFLSYGPLNPHDCDDYSFGKIPTPAPSQSLEWQILKKFMEDSPNMLPFKKAERSNPAASGFKNGQLMADDPSNPDPTREGDSSWQFCSYMWFWWSREAGQLMTYDGLTDYPINILNKAFPNKDNYRSELQLLSGEANNFKERLWGVGVIRKDRDVERYVTSDVNKAINFCKQVMFAVKYVGKAWRGSNHRFDVLDALIPGPKVQQDGSPLVVVSLWALLTWDDVRVRDRCRLLRLLPC
jgi:hypothetical protein